MSKGVENQALAKTFAAYIVSAARSGDEILKQHVWDLLRMLDGDPGAKKFQMWVETLGPLSGVGLEDATRRGTWAMAWEAQVLAALEQLSPHDRLRVLHRLARLGEPAPLEPPLSLESQVVPSQDEASFEARMARAEALRERIAQALGDATQQLMPAGAAGIVAGAEVPAAEEVVLAGDTLEHTLARLFVRLGPPPEPTSRDYAPVGAGDGGAAE